MDLTNKEIQNIVPQQCYVQYVEMERRDLDTIIQECRQVKDIEAPEQKTAQDPTQQKRGIEEGWAAEHLDNESRRKSDEHIAQLDNTKREISAGPPEPEQESTMDTEMSNEMDNDMER
jgi:hypothetical protein